MNLLSFFQPARFFLFVAFCTLAPLGAFAQDGDDAGAQNPTAPERVKSETPDKEPDARRESAAPREGSTPSEAQAPRERVTAPPAAAAKKAPAANQKQTNQKEKSYSTSDPLDWEILDEPAKLPSTPSTPVPIRNPDAPFSNASLLSIAREKNLALPLRDARVVILKSQRRMDLYSGDTLVKSYRIALGGNPVGHKQKQGDSRTPEGRFYICTRNSKTSDFHIFLGLSYPALPDAKRGVNNNQITWREYQVINQRLAAHDKPLWETNLGGWIGIHGGTNGSFAQKKMRARGSKDWTAGCIGLTNKQIEEIHAATKLGTPVTIRP